MTYTWFRDLPEDVQSDMLSRTVLRELAQGERLHARGDEADGMYYVVGGAVRVSGLVSDGREIVLDVYGPGVWFGELGAFDGMPRTHNAHAYEATTLRQLGFADLEDLLARYPILSRSLLRLEAQRLRILLSALEAYTSQPLEQRLASRLLMLAGQYGRATTRGVRIELHLSQEVLAQLIGATRQRVNQILKLWESDGILYQRYGETILTDVAKLEKIAES
jgi:CRP-like cAMP-binding protein